MQDKNKNRQTLHLFTSTAHLHRSLVVLVIIIGSFTDMNTITPVVSTQVPLQCLKFINLTEVKNGGGMIRTTIPETLCDHSPREIGWYRFKYARLNNYFWSNIHFFYRFIPSG